MTTGEDRITLLNRTDFVTGAAQRYLPDIEALAAVPDRVAAAIAGKPAEALRRSPAEGDWSPLRIVGHMVAYARGTRVHLQQMATMTDPLLKPIDDAAEAAANDWESQDPARLLDQLREAVSGSVDVLKWVPDSSWGRAGVHPLGGRRSIRQHAQRAVSHFESHVEELGRLLS
jgi:hypothetical protein